MMLFVVTLISLLVHIYSTDYVNGDLRYTHFFAFLILFTASMLLLVISATTLQFITGWELVGVCSFVLDRPLVGGEEELRRRRSRRSSPTASATSACWSA